MMRYSYNNSVLRCRFWLSILLIFACLPLLTSCEKRRTIVNELDEKEANEILVFLSQKGIETIKIKHASEGGGGGSKATLWDISVPENQANEAMSMLNQYGLPRRHGQNLLGIFANSGLVPSEMTEKIRYQAGLAEQIASTIRKIDGVLDAEVQISFPEEDPLHPEKQNQKKITASVYVKHSGVFDDPNSHLAAKIKRLVAASVSGLDYDNVTVVAERSRYGDYAAQGIIGGDESKEYVKLWSVIVANESASRFRTIFFSFVVTIALLLASLFWICWKVFPLLSQCGGFKQLFTLHPLHIDNSDNANDDNNTPPSEDVGKKPPPANSSAADSQVDET